MQLCCWMQMSQYWETSHTSSACQQTLLQCWIMARLCIGSCSLALPRQKQMSACINSSGTVACQRRVCLHRRLAALLGPGQLALAVSLPIEMRLAVQAPACCRYSGMGSIQAGVIMLRPCAQLAQHMQDVAAGNELLQFPYSNAEQDFLSW